MFHQFFGTLAGKPKTFFKNRHRRFLQKNLRTVFLWNTSKQLLLEIVDDDELFLWYG